MNYTSENLCVCFLCFMLGYLFCQNMRGTEGIEHYEDDFLPGATKPTDYGEDLLGDYIDPNNPYQRPSGIERCREFPDGKCPTSQDPYCGHQGREPC